MKNAWNFQKFNNILIISKKKSLSRKRLTFSRV